jgi:hypothetical protein
MSVNTPTILKPFLDGTPENKEENVNFVGGG